eukprot:gene32529-42140_t
MRKVTVGKSDQPDFNLHDLIIDETDFCRGYGEDTNKYTEKYFENSNNDDDEEEIGEETDEILNIDDDFKAPEMPEEFYSHVDSFLKRPAPKLQGDDSISKRKDSKNEPSIPMFPKINAPKVKELSDNGSAEKAVRKPKKKSIKDTEFKQERAINNALLREAFAYTDQLLREAVIQEAKEVKEKEKQEQLVAELSNHRTVAEKVLPKSAPQAETVFGHPIEGAAHFSKTQKPSEGGSGVSAIRKLRNKQASKPKGHSNTHNNSNNNSSSSSHAINANTMQSDFDVSADTEVDLKKNAINFDDLVSNFQNGTTLRKLQRELEQSKQSMQRSEQFLKNLSLEYLNKL